MCIKLVIAFFFHTSKLFLRILLIFLFVGVFIIVKIYGILCFYVFHSNLVVFINSNTRHI